MTRGLSFFVFCLRTGLLATATSTRRFSICEVVAALLFAPAKPTKLGVVIPWFDIFGSGRSSAYLTLSNSQLPTRFILRSQTSIQRPSHVNSSGIRDNTIYVPSRHPPIGKCHQSRTTVYFASAGSAPGRVINSADYELIVRQKPLHAKVFIGKEKDRKPIDPPPIVQLKVNEASDPAQNFLQNPYFFISTSLVDDEETQPPADREEVKNALAGTLVSSLHRLKDSDNADAGFFVFGDLSVKIEGTFKLQFTLYEVRGKEVEYITSITSEPFTVHPAKNWPGMAESTFLTRSFSDQGVRLRLRKEPRFRLGPRGPGSDNYEPRHYNTSKRRQSRQMEAAAQEGTQLPITPQSQEAIAAGASRKTKIEPSDGGLGSIPSQAGGMYPMDNRKRGFSQTSQASLYGAPQDESAAKRSRQEMDDPNQLSFTGQPQFPGGPGMGYGGQQFADPFQVQQPLMYPQHPQQPMQTFDQFSPTYMAPSPHQRMPRDQQQQPQGYFSPRRAEQPFQPP
ncbi:hypothetical protein O988_06136, partial [Pseudogymnoascus sp. VKM F-3808]